MVHVHVLYLTARHQLYSIYCSLSYILADLFFVAHNDHISLHCTYLFVIFPSFSSWATFRDRSNWAEAQRGCTCNINSSVGAGAGYLNRCIPRSPGVECHYPDDLDRTEKGNNIFSTWLVTITASMIFHQQLGRMCIYRAYHWIGTVTWSILCN